MNEISNLRGALKIEWDKNATLKKSIYDSHDNAFNVNMQF